MQIILVLRFLHGTQFALFYSPEWSKAKKGGAKQRRVEQIKAWLSKTKHIRAKQSSVEQSKAK